MNVQKCDKCHQTNIFAIMYPNHCPNTINLNGVTWVYKDGNKQYLKECCLETYLVGIQNNYIDYDQQRAICIHFKSSLFKTLLIGESTVEYKVFELKENKYNSFKCTRTNKTIKFNRRICINESNETYKIFTNSELKKYQKTLNVSIPMDVDMSPDCNDLNHYIYLLQDRTAVAVNAPIYKVGKTTQPNFERFKNYPKGYKIIILAGCTNCHTIEKNILELFRLKYIPRLDYDTESFEGSVINMRNDINDIIREYDDK